MIGNTVRTKVVVDGCIITLCNYNKDQFVVFNASGRLFKIFNNLSDAENFLNKQ